MDRWLSCILCDPQIYDVITHFTIPTMCSGSPESITRLDEYRQKMLKKSRLLDSIAKKVLKECFKDALAVTAKDQKWWNDKNSDFREKIVDKLQKVFLLYLSEFQKSKSKDVLGQIFHKYVNRDISDADRDYFTRVFKDKLEERFKSNTSSANEASSLKGYLTDMHILNVSANGEVTSHDSPYILTPEQNTIITQKTYDLTRRQEAIVKEVYDEIASSLKNGEIGKFRKQFYGPGGVGKSVILESVYKRIVNDNPDKKVTHVAFIPYTGTLDNSLFNSIPCPGGKSVDAVQQYLQDLFKNSLDSVVLLFIDDNRPQQEEKQITELGNLIDSFRGLKVAVLLSSQEELVTFKQTKQTKLIDFLNKADCKTLFETECKKLKANNKLNVSTKFNVFLDKYFETPDKRTPLKVAQLANKAVEVMDKKTELNEALAIKLANKLGITVNRTLGFGKVKSYGKGVEPTSDFKSLKKGQKEMLEVFALFPGIPLELSTCKYLFCTDRYDKAEAKTYKDTLESLKGIWLSSISIKEESCYFMHHAVKDSVIMHLKNVVPFDKHQKLVKRLCEAISLDNDFEHADTCVRCSSSLARYFKHNNCKKVELVNLMVHIGRYYEAVHNYSKALEWYKDYALQLLEQQWGTKHHYSAVIYNNIASVYSKYGKYDEALNRYKNNLNLFKEEKAGTATFYNVMAEVLFYKRKYDESLDYYENKALPVREKTFDLPVTYRFKEHKEKIKNNFENGKKKVAFKEYDEFLTDYKRELIVNNDSVAVLYNNIAEVYSRKGEYNTALEKYEQALIECKKELKENRSVVTLEDITILLDDNKVAEYKKAIDKVKKSLNNVEAKNFVNTFYDTLKNFLPMELVPLFDKAKADVKNSDDTTTLPSKEKSVYKAFKNALLDALSVCDREGVIESFSPIIDYDEINTLFKEYDDQKRLYNRTLDICKKKTMSVNNFAAILYNNRAGTCSRHGQYLKALLEYMHALTICETVLGVKHTTTAVTYNNIAGFFSRHGFYDEALEWYGKVLVICERASGGKDLSTALVYNNIAYIFFRQGHQELSRRWYEEALKIRKKRLGVNHSSVATIYNNLASVYDVWGNYGSALAGYKKALSIRKKFLGINHPDTATTYNNMAGVFFRKGDYNKALWGYQAALDIRVKVLGVEHPETANTYNNMAAVHDMQKKHIDALMEYQEALAIRKNALGEEHVETASSYNNLADFYFQQNMYDEALGLYKKSLKIRKDVLGNDHHSTATSFNNIASIHAVLGAHASLDKEKNKKYATALKYYKRALSIREKVLDTPPKTKGRSKDVHSDTAITHNNIAYIYYKKGDKEAAKKEYQKALTVLKVKLGSKHPYTKIVQKNYEKCK